MRGAVIEVIMRGMAAEMAVAVAGGVAMAAAAVAVADEQLLRWSVPPSERVRAILA